ncbi:MAG: LYR motif-containing protein [Pseudomonadota bacterium]
MSFIFGGNTGKTYEQLLDERKYLDNIQRQGRDSFNPVQNIGLSLGRLGTAFFQGQNASAIADREAEQNKALENDLSLLSTPGLSAKMASNMQDPRVHQSMVAQDQQNRQEAISRMMTNPALQRNPAAGNVFSQVMRNKSAAQAPITPYQQAQLKNDAAGYALQAATLEADSNYKKGMLEATIGRDKAAQDHQKQVLAYNKQQDENNRRLQQEQHDWKRKAKNYEKSIGLYRIFNKERRRYDNFDTQMRQVDLIKNDFDKNKNITGPQAFALAMKVGKLLDPESVFREGEFAALSNSGDIYQGVLKFIEGAEGNQKQFTPEMLGDLFGLVSNLRGAVDEKFQDVRDDFGLRAERHGLNVLDVLGDKYGQSYIDGEVIGEKTKQEGAQNNGQTVSDDVYASNQEMMNDPNSILGMPSNETRKPIRIIKYGQ